MVCLNGVKAAAISSDGAEFAPAKLKFAPAKEIYWQGTVYSAVLMVLSLAPALRAGVFFFGATSGIFSMMISALGFSGSNPQ